MKIEKLAEDKIKITITIDDLAARNIDLHSFMYNSPESQDLFWDVMNEAEKEYGFNVDDSMIYVEASTSGGGNFTLIVTKTKEKPVIRFNTSKEQRLKRNCVKLKRKKTPIVTEDAIYQFNSFDDICDFCKTIDTKKLKDNSLFILNDCYYLKTSFMPFATILEYATVAKKASFIEAKIAEYGKIVTSKNALQTISEHFDKKKCTRKINKKAENL